MDLKTVNSINRNPEFAKEIEGSQRSILILLTLTGFFAIGFRQLFDFFMGIQGLSQVFELRKITAAVLVLNLLAGLARKNHKQHVIAGFYIMALHCMFLALFTGGITSTYWFGLIYVLVAWFVFMPYTYRDIILHGTLFVILFFGGLAFEPVNPELRFEIYKILFLYLGTLLLGSFSAYSRNRSRARGFEATGALNIANRKLGDMNEELRKEIGNHQQTLNQLRSNEKFIDSIIANAPIVLWSFDTNGVFTYSHGKVLSNIGVESKSSIGKSVFDIYKGTEAESFVRRVLNGETLNDLVTLNGICFDTRVTPIKDEKGTITGYIGVAMDITNQEKDRKDLERFKLALHQAPAAVYIISNELRFEYINPAFTRQSGYTEEDTINRHVNDSIYRGRIPESRLHIAEALRRGETWQGVLESHHKSGRIYYASTVASPYLNAQGKVDGYIIIQQDITENKLMEEALRESELKYKTLVENSQDGIFALLGENIHFVNNTFSRMLGYSSEEILKMDPYHLIHPDDYGKGRQIHEQRSMGITGTLSEVFRFRTKDGHNIECETHSSVVEINGEQLSYITVHDISETRKMEEKLRESEKKYRTLIDKATDGILITQEGVFRFVNPAFCEMMQYTENELINRPFIDVVDQSHHAEMLENHKRRMQGENFPAIYRARLFRKDGSSIMVELNSRTTDFGGKPASFVITRDITDRLQTEEELLKAKAELENLNRSLEARVKESSESLAEARTQLIRLQKENLQSQFEVLRQQVNPHFLFNSLNVLTSLIKLEPDLAEKFTEHLSKVYRYVLENKDNDLVDLKTELDFLDAYLFLLNIRFMDKIQVGINISPEQTAYLILPLALQLLIENAIKHNSMSKKNPLYINIFVDNNRFLNVVNNLQERGSYIVSTGVGLKNIELRYSLLEMPAPEFIKTDSSFIAKIPLKDLQ